MCSSCFQDYLILPLFDWKIVLMTDEKFLVSFYFALFFFYSFTIPLALVTTENPGPKHIICEDNCELVQYSIVDSNVVPVEMRTTCVSGALSSEKVSPTPLAEISKLQI